MGQTFLDPGHVETCGLEHLAKETQKHGVDAHATITQPNDTSTDDGEPDLMASEYQGGEYRMMYRIPAHIHTCNVPLVPLFFFFFACALGYII